MKALNRDFDYQMKATSSSNFTDVLEWRDTHFKIKIIKFINFNLSLK